MLYLKEHHQLLQILDESREEEDELSESLHTLIAMEYGQTPNSLLELASQLTEC